MNNLPIKYTYFCGENDAEKLPHKHNNRCFPFIVAVHVNEGTYICEYDNKKIVVETGETLIVPEYVIHHVGMESSGLLTWAHFSAHFEKYDILCNFEVPFVVSEKFSDSIKTSIAALNHCDTTCLGALNRDHSISDLIITVLQNCNVVDISGRKAWIINLKKYINENITGRLTIKDLAAYCHMSESSFSHKFRSEVGVSPVKYIIRQKINTSLVMLDAGDTLASISNKLNFANEYYYSKQFKAVTGMNPSDYRKNRTTP